MVMTASQYPSLPTVHALDLYEDPDVIPVAQFLKAGKPKIWATRLFFKRWPRNSLGIGMGDTVSVYTPLMLERMRNNEILLPRDLKVAGIIESGWGQLDSNTMVLNLRLMQELYGLDYGIHGLAVRLEAGSS